MNEEKTPFRKSNLVKEIIKVIPVIKQPPKSSPPPTPEKKK